MTELPHDLDFSEKALHAHGRGTKGQIAYGVNEKTGELVSVLSVPEGGQIVVITSQGQTIKMDIMMI